MTAEGSGQKSQTGKSLMAYRGDIEGLRAVAIVLVVFYHAHVVGFNGGFVGVDIFFVLSGYLITNLLVKEVAQTGHLNIFAFYARRLRRLMPASLLMVAATIFASRFLLSPLEQAHIFWSAAATLCYVSNFYFIHQALDYWAANTGINPFLHTWSLAVEEQFYLVWPFVILAAMKGKSSKTRLVTVLSIISAISLVASIRFTFTNNWWAFFGSPFRAWEFGIGGLGCLVPERQITKSKIIPWALGMAGLALIAYGGVFLSATTPFPGYAALIPVIGTVMLLIAGSGAEPIGTSLLLGSKPFRVVGGLSYSWYLWHWPVLVIATCIYSGKLPLFASLCCVFGSLLVAFVAHHAVENPIRFSPRLMRSPALTGACAGLALVVSLSFIVVWHTWVHRQPQYKKFAAAESDGPKLSNCKLEQQLLSVCTVNESGSPTVVLFGDSHAQQWEPPLEQIALRNGWKLAIISRESCAAADVQAYLPDPGKFAGRRCLEWRHLAMRKIREINPMAVILVSYSKGSVEPIGRLSVPMWQQSTRATLASVSSAASHVFLIEDTPTPSVNIPDCLSRADWTHTSEDICSFDRHDKVFDAIVASEGAATEGLGNVTALDLSSYICGPTICDPVENGVIKFVDAHHLTASFTRSLAPVFDRLLRNNGL
jgi:peptidoglycan/LPS O-acetylase OafA/YrhL